MRLPFSTFGQSDRQDAVAVAGLDFVSVHFCRQIEAAVEGQMPFFGALFFFFLRCVRGADNQLPPAQLDVEIFGFETRSFGTHNDGIFFVLDFADPTQTPVLVRPKCRPATEGLLEKPVHLPAQSAERFQTTRKDRH